MKHEVQKKRRFGIWGAPVLCGEGTRNCGEGAWDQIRLGARGVRNENLALGNAAQSPGLGLLPLGSPQKLGGGIVGLGPASELVLAVAWVSSEGCAAACRAARGVFIPFSPPLFQFTTHRASLAIGLQLSPGGTGNLCPRPHCLRRAVSVWRAELILE